MEADAEDQEEVIRFDWIYGRVTLTWEIRLDDWSQACGLVRVHDSEKQVPGDYHCVVSVIVKGGVYEKKGFVSRRKRSPRGHEYKALDKLLKSLGLQEKFHVRARSGRKVRVVHKKAANIEVL
jgi:hypothetical protein